MYTYIKRFFDFFTAAIALALLSILLIPIVLLLRVTGEGKIFYLQQRIGFKTNPFSIYKFATMLENSINMGLGGTTVRDDPRITPVGKYLRFTKVNELPQLLNVLFGDMSFVGPRPLPIKSFQRYTSEVQKIIYQNRPGITGIGSLVFRDEEKLVTAVVNQGLNHSAFYSEYIFPYKGELEKWYYHNKSFGVDLKIILLTAWCIVFPKSEIIYKVFSNLPHRPDSLTIKGIHNLQKS